MNIITAIIPELLKLLEPDVVQDTLRKIHEDPMLVKTTYSLGSTAGFLSVDMVIANASKELPTPKLDHQLLAKGIVYELVSDGPDCVVSFKLLSLPFTKFYNSFEGIAVADVTKLECEKCLDNNISYTKILTRKYDGTMISRFVYEGTVYWATRGKILNFEKNKYWDLLHTVLNSNFLKKVLNKCDYWDRVTTIFELIGPDNPHVEFHSKNDLVLLGAYSKPENAFFNYTEAEVYEGDDPEKVIKSWSKIQEGLVVNYVRDNDEVVYRVKFKTEAYLSLLHAKNSASPKTLFSLCVENKLGPKWDSVENFLRSFLAQNPYFEELLEYYKGVWEEYGFAEKLEDCNDTQFAIYSLSGCADFQKLTTRKEQFFFAKESLGDLAGLAMSHLDGKLTDDQMNARVAEKYLKELKVV